MSTTSWPTTPGTLYLQGDHPSVDQRPTVRPYHRSQSLSVSSSNLRPWTADAIARLPSLTSIHSDTVSFAELARLFDSGLLQRFTTVSACYWDSLPSPAQLGAILAGCPKLESVPRLSMPGVERLISRPTAAMSSPTNELQIENVVVCGPFSGSCGAQLHACFPRLRRLEQVSSTPVWYSFGELCAGLHGLDHLEALQLEYTSCDDQASVTNCTRGLCGLTELTSISAGCRWT